MIQNQNPTKFKAERAAHFSELEKLKVSEAMLKNGNSFIKSLGVTLACADTYDTQKIKQTFPEYWEQYLQIYEKGLSNYNG